MTRKNTNQALPAVEATILVEGITAPIVKCTARKAFQVNNASVQEGETFFLVKSDRRPGRYYIVKFNAERHCYQCSCGANCKSHSHTKAAQQYILEHVVRKAAQTVVSPVSTSKVEEVHTDLASGERPLTAAEWREIHKADKARQRAWANEYRAEAEKLRKVS